MKTLQLAVISSILAEQPVLLFVPPVVNVSEGQVAVVCFRMDFSDALEQGSGGIDRTFQLNVTLEVEDVETSEFHPTVHLFGVTL